MRTLRFHFDPISPYAWLAWTRLPELAARHGTQIEPVPVLLAALLNHHGQRGPAEIEAKRRYVFEDVVRHADALGLPLRPPPTHPFNPLLALRVASLPMPTPTRCRLVDRLFRAVWCEGTGVEDPAYVEQIAREEGIDDAVARSQDPVIKAALREANERAITEGVFGVPTVIVDGVRFWGLDSLPHLERALQGVDPVRERAEVVAAFEGLRGSAWRG